MSCRLHSHMSKAQLIESGAECGDRTLGSNREGTGHTSPRLYLYETLVHDPRVLWPDTLSVLKKWLSVFHRQSAHRQPMF